MRNGGKWIGPMAVAGALAIGAPSAFADVKTGVDAWAQGDFVKAVGEWRPLAAAGDPDAQFNLGQAYRLGRGVPVDLPIALGWFRKASAQGHARAEDNYGLLLFQMNRRDEAMPYIQRSATRGEPRAQYLLGTALFNGEFEGKNWIKAYALMTRAAAAGLPQAAASLQQMDRHIPLDQRQKGLAMAAEIEKRDRAILAEASRPAPPVMRGTPNAAPAKPAAKPAKPQPRLATADVKKPAPPKAAPKKPEPAKSAVAKAEPKKAEPAKPSPSGSGNWRVQLGAFSEEGRAKTLWSSLSGKVGGLSKYQSYYVKGGNMTRLQVGPLTSGAEAEKLCRTIKAAGSDCLTKKL